MASRPSHIYFSTASRRDRSWRGRGRRRLAGAAARTTVLLSAATVALGALTVERLFG